jgi:hypothetical protein
MHSFTHTYIYAIIYASIIIDVRAPCQRAVVTRKHGLIPMDAASGGKSARGVSSSHDDRPDTDCSIKRRARRDTKFFRTYLAVTSVLRTSCFVPFFVRPVHASLYSRRAVRRLCRARGAIRVATSVHIRIDRRCQTCHVPGLRQRDKGTGPGLGNG